MFVELFFQFLLIDIVVVLAEAAKDYFLNLAVAHEAIAHFANGNFRCFIHRIAVNARADTWKCDGLDAVFIGNSHAVTIALGQ